MSEWRPGADRAVLQARAALLAQLRSFLDQRDCLEVDTPLLCRYGVTDPSIEPLQVPRGASIDAPRFLQSSPEYAMKRLLAAGSGAIYQLGKAFRDGEVGARHNPEFTLLEWYRPGWSLTQLIEETTLLVGSVLGRDDCQRLSVRELYLSQLDVDPLTAGSAELADCARRHIDCAQLQLDRDGWLDLLMSHVLEPRLPAGLVVLEDYPASQAALAQVVQRGDSLVAERFELYVDGLELANGYQELRDAAELAQRAATDNHRRRRNGQCQRINDPRLLAAMQAGLPACCGVALGVDRLLMLRLGATRLEAVLPFDWSRS